MNAISFPLSPQMQGAKVADLQDALRVVLDRRAVLATSDADREALAERVKAERTEQKYGEGTRKVVAVFQRERDLPPHDGMVNEATAAALNALLRGWGLLDGAAQTPTVPRAAVVGGRVVRDDGLPVAGVRVVAFHADGRGDIRLGADATDPDGRYTLRYEPLPGVDAVKLSVSAIGDDGRTLATSRPDHPAGSLEVVNLTVPVGTIAADDHQFEGAVVLAHGAAAEKMTLRLYRREFGGGATKLDETTTRGQGRYAFRYPAGAAGLSLEVRAVAGDRETVLTAPLHDLAGTPRAVVNLAAPSVLQPPAAEYRRLHDALAPHVGTPAKLAGAKEADGRQELSLLNRVSGWDARLLALAATAEQLGGDPEVGLSGEAVYGLLRVGLPSDKRMLARVGADGVKLALQKARGAGVIALTDPQLLAVQQQYAAFSRKVRLADPLPGGRATYADLLDKAGLDPATRERFADVFLANRGGDLWKAAEAAKVPVPAIRKLQLQGKVSYLTGHSGPLAARLVGRVKQTPAELVSADFHMPDTWKGG